MQDKHEELLPTTEPNKLLSVEVYYNLGGMNFFTGNGEARGYYLSVTPVKVANGWRETTAFSGTKQIVLAVKRQSPKGLAEAIRLAGPLKENLIRHVLAKNKLELAKAQEVK